MDESRRQRDRITDELDDALADADAETTEQARDLALHRAILATIRLRNWCAERRIELKLKAEAA